MRHMTTYICNKTSLTILPVTEDSLEDWFLLCTQLWPRENPINLHQSLKRVLKNPQQQGFIIRTDKKDPIGFMNLSLRYDHVPGATESPVAYIEGIFISQQYRQAGLGNHLITLAEKWGKEKGCKEIASDTLLNNTNSQDFHKKAGFNEVERTVNYLKPL